MGIDSELLDKVLNEILKGESRITYTNIPTLIATYGEFTVEEVLIYIDDNLTHILADKLRRYARWNYCKDCLPSDAREVEVCFKHGDLLLKGIARHDWKYWLHQKEEQEKHFELSYQLHWDNVGKPENIYAWREIDYSVAPLP
jgi:hypothetical protein